MRSDQQTSIVGARFIAPLVSGWTDKQGAINRAPTKGEI
jgi:hypothetical protein